MTCFEPMLSYEAHWDKKWATFEHASLGMTIHFPESNIIYQMLQSHHDMQNKFLDRKLPLIHYWVGGEMFGGREENWVQWEFFGFGKSNRPQGPPTWSRVPTGPLYIYIHNSCVSTWIWKREHYKFSAVDSPPHPILVLCHPVGRNIVERATNKVAQTFLEIQSPQKLRNAKKSNGLNSTLSKLLEIQAPRTCSQMRQPQRETSVLNDPFWFSKISKEG